MGVIVFAVKKAEVPSESGSKDDSSYNHTFTLVGV